MKNPIYTIDIGTRELFAMRRKEQLDFLFRKHRLSPLCSLCQKEFLTEVLAWLVPGTTDSCVVYGLCDACRALPDSKQQIERIIHEVYADERIPNQ